MRFPSLPSKWNALFSLHHVLVNNTSYIPGLQHQDVGVVHHNEWKQFILHFTIPSGF